MKFTNSVAEKEIRADLIGSKQYLLESKKGQCALERVKELCGDIKTVYVLAHTPEQAEDIFRILVDGHKIIGFDLQDASGRFEALNIVTYSMNEYDRLASKIGRLKLAIAIDLSRNDLLTETLNTKNRLN